MNEMKELSNLPERREQPVHVRMLRGVSEELSSSEHPFQLHPELTPLSPEHCQVFFTNYAPVKLEY